MPISADYSIPGMRIRAGRADEPWALVVQTAARQDWVEELTDLVERISRPRVPTCIHYRDRFYRIDSVEETTSGWIYRMTVWPPNEPRMNVFELDQTRIKADTIEKKLFDLDLRQGRNAIWWAWVFGWLPSGVQDELAERHNFSPCDASRIQAFFQCIFFLGMLWSKIAEVIAGSYIGMDASITALWIVYGLIIEGAVRWGHTLVTQEPCGFWPVELAWRIVGRFRCV